MGVIAMLETVLTFQFLIPACIIAAAMLAGLHFLQQQDAEGKKVVAVAASKGLSLTLGELAAYDGSAAGKPVLISVLGTLYDVGGSGSSGGAGLYGKGAPYNCFAGREVGVAMAKFNKSEGKLLNAKWLNLNKEERALLTKFEKTLQSKYSEVGKISDPENLHEAPEADGEVSAMADAFSTQTGLAMFERGHITESK
eukprot:CAMPEP_0197601346 /NCGR_PEP_ID=MMETSP1326-20131121/35114_1 /TAXON_ID=1155430 /ORGANISM="Genus nov. species nov., Strain RCC2288" /LENGTH=196 /DNA_ID=CAMNT_0043168573 /DNA_START=68 /DNA_END=658 /DNA_ORIENTATION=-